MAYCQLNLLFSIRIFIAVMQFEIFIVNGEPQVPCYFIFGDSLVDSGNNNKLVTRAKANYPPYGIDFPQGVTGRFTNGRTIADIIGELLDFDEYIPAFVTATDSHISKGVNYGSGAAGIRDETGSHLGGRISFDRQLRNHNTTLSRLFHLQRNTTFTNEHLSKCIYVVNIGSNDYINNYLMPTIYTTSHKHTPYEYATLLTRQYARQLKTLYDLGGRKIVVFGLGPVGCTPAEISIFGTDGSPCVESINDAVRQFNDKLKPLIHELNHENPDARFTFINLTSISSLQEGIRLSNVPCCKVRVDGQCAQNALVCPDRAMSVYYDGFHPTEVATVLIASTSYTALSPMDASPYDISQLVRL
ncbi:GDSL esterase/lipase At1g29670-like [Cynara cardunculus var. scolymus]|uniref:GDSL esterase/lipase At1g29670-like n=1 Tax=Cynara cardunculus var. scolymus TaxID=59895 RepID=UPI000D62EEFE|nr:GDSL esterase/lipase At1g29670-like [Cynara cardunculus var. scolymus]